MTISEWSPYTTYIFGDRVNYIGQSYTATAVNRNVTPQPATTIWLVGTPTSGVAITTSNANTTVYPTFVSGTSGVLPILVDTDLTYNPALGDLAITQTLKIQSSLSGSRVAVGSSAGSTAQSQGAVAIGGLAGVSNQGLNAVSIGALAGNSNQGNYAIAIGDASGVNTQGANAVSVGVGAGFQNQGASCIAIGQQAGETNQHANSLILNATGLALNSDGANRFYVKPIRNVALTNTLTYDSKTGEIGYTPIPSSMMGGSATQLSSTSARFMGLPIGNIGGTSATNIEADAQQVIPFDCSLSNFYVRYGLVVGTAGNGFTTRIRKNGVNTSVLITITGAVQIGSDLVNSVSFVSGDLFSISVAPVGTPTNFLAVRWSLRMSLT